MKHQLAGRVYEDSDHTFGIAVGTHSMYNNCTETHSDGEVLSPFPFPLSTIV